MSTTYFVDSIFFKLICLRTMKEGTDLTSYLHGILIRGIISRVNDANALAPVQPKRGAQDIDGGSALVPLDGRLGLERAVGLARREARLLNHCLGVLHHVRPQV